jgi:tetratricopeptide (TPR) repeat protein
LILITALALAIGIPVMVFVYWSDRHVDTGGSVSDRTVAAAEAAVQANPNDLQARDYLAAAYVSAKRYDDGITQFTEALQIDPADRPALLGRAIAYVEIGQLDAAATDLNAFIDTAAAGEFAGSDPQLEHAYYELGLVQLQKGLAADAVTTLQKAIAINGADADALYLLGQALNKTGDPTKALSALKLSVAFVPTGWCEPYQELAVSYTALQQPDGVAWAGGMVAFCQGRPDEATTALKPLTTGAMKTDALIGLALVASQSGDNTAATSYYRQVLAIDPTNQSAQIGLSSLGAGDVAAPSEVASPTAGGNN